MTAIWRLIISAILCAVLLAGCGPSASEHFPVSPTFNSPLPEDIPDSENALSTGEPSEIAQPFIAEDYDTALPEPQPLPMASDTQSYRTGNRLVICDDDASIYLIAETDTAGIDGLYRYKNETAQCLYVSGGLDHLTASGDYLYFGNLYRMPLTGGTPEYIVNTSWFQTSGQTIFAQNEISVGVRTLTAFPAAAPTQIITLWQDTDKISLNRFQAGPCGVAFILSSRATPSGTQSPISRLYYQSSEGTRIMIDEIYDGNFGDDLQFYQGALYYSIHGKDSSTIYCADLGTGEITQCFFCPNRYIDFSVYDDSLFITTGSNMDGSADCAFSKIKLDGSVVTAIAEYGIHGQRTALDIGHGVFMLPTKDYLYLEGVSNIEGTWIVTRVSLANADDEEVFFKGKWLSCDEYYGQIYT